MEKVDRVGLQMTTLKNLGSTVQDDVASLS